MTKDLIPEGVVKGLVSVIIPAHNRPVLLAEAVASVRHQTYSDFELIIVDDDSGPETAGLCARLAEDDARIQVIRIRRTGRPGLVREVGRLAAKGEYLQYLDSDDLLASRKLEIMTTALQANQDCDIAYCSTRRYLRGQRPREIATERTGEGFASLFPDCLAGRFWHTSTPLYTRRITDLAGSWCDLPYWEDVEYDLRMATLGAKLVHCPEFLVDFRDHDDERLSTSNFFVDPSTMRHAPDAYRRLAQHAVRSGLSAEATPMRAFLEEIREMADCCESIGLDREALECRTLIDWTKHQVSNASVAASAGEKLIER